MNTFRTVVTYIGLTVAMMLLITDMMIQFLRVAFPKGPEMEAKMPIIEERAEQRAKALEQLKEEAMCEDTRFNIDCD